MSTSQPNSTQQPQVQYSSYFTPTTSYQSQMPYSQKYQGYSQQDHRVQMNYFYSQMSSNVLPYPESAQFAKPYSSQPYYSYNSYAQSSPYTAFQYSQASQIDPHQASFPIPQPLPLKNEYNNLSNQQSSAYNPGYGPQQRYSNNKKYSKNFYTKQTQGNTEANQENQNHQKKAKKKSQQNKTANIQENQGFQNQSTNENPKDKKNQRHVLKLVESDLLILADEIVQTKEQKEDIREKKKIAFVKQSTMQQFNQGISKEIFEFSDPPLDMDLKKTYQSEEESKAQKKSRDNFDRSKGNFTYSEWDFPLEITAAKHKPKKQKIIQEEIKIEDQKIEEECKEEQKEVREKPKSKPKEANSKQAKELNENTVKEMIEESEYYQQWKSIPKSQRERLTKKQMLRVMKPDMLSESIKVEVADGKPQKTKKNLDNQNEREAPPTKNVNFTENNQVASKAELIPTHAKKLEVQVNESFSKTSQQDTSIHHQGYKPKVSNFQTQYYQQQQLNNKIKTKPKKIVVEERNENNEIVRHIIEKSRKRKVTALKKAILKKRDRDLTRKEGKLSKEAAKKLKSELKEDELSSGYVTVDENNDTPLLQNNPSTKQAALESQNQEIERRLIETRGFPYTQVFYDLEGACQQVEDQLIKGSLPKLERKSSIQSNYVKLLVQEGDDQGTNMSLHPKKNIRDYADMIQTPELDTIIFALIQKLKKLYYNRKANPNKKGKVTRNIKKRYIVGMKEVIKNLNAEKLKMVVLAINLERVEGDKGLDDMVYHIIQTTKEQKIPLVFALTRYKLGFVTKYQGQMASVVGIFNFQGANEEFSQLVNKSKEQREQFYTQLAKNLSEYELKLLRKENRYLDWQLFDKIKSDPMTYYS